MAIVIFTPCSGVSQREPKHTLYQALEKNNDDFTHYSQAVVPPSTADSEKALLENTLLVTLTSENSVMCDVTLTLVQKQNSGCLELLYFQTISKSNKTRVLVIRLGYQCTAKETQKRSLGISVETRSCFTLSLVPSSKCK